MNDAEKVDALRSAIERADRKLEWILGDPRHSEWMLTTAKHVRNILRAALKRTDPPASAAERAAAVEDLSSLPKVKLGRRAIESMIDDGIIKTNRRKTK